MRELGRAMVEQWLEQIGDKIDASCNMYVCMLAYLHGSLAKSKSRGSMMHYENILTILKNDYDGDCNIIQYE